MVTLNWIIIVKPLIAILIVLLYLYGNKKRSKTIKNISIVLGVVYIIILSTINIVITGYKKQALKEENVATQNFEASMSMPTKRVKELNYTKSLQKFDKEFTQEQQKIFKK